MVTVAPGSDNPDSLNTVPATTEYAVEALDFWADPTNGRQRDHRRRKLLPVLIFFVFFFLILVVFVEVVVLLVFVVFILLGRGNQFERIHALYGQVGAALLADQLIAFVEFIFFRIYGRITQRAIHHDFLQGIADGVSV
jgi:hypothetical protein